MIEGALPPADYHWYSQPMHLSLPYCVADSGRYTVEDNQLTLQIGGQPPETITTAVPRGNRVTFDTVLYIRQ